MGPQAKGNKMKGGVGSSWKPKPAAGSRGSMGKVSEKPWVPKASSRKPWTQGEAKGSHAGGKGC